jgi:hypothetical protein
MKKRLFLILCAVTIASALYAQNSVPGLVFVCELQVKLDPALVVGETAHGTRRIIPIIGGTVQGPNIKGEILTGGADWQVVRKDGVTELEAHYQFKTDDGALIYIKNEGIRVASPEVAAKITRGEKVDVREYYFRAVPKFEAPVGKYQWMNNTLFICTGERLPNAVKINVFQVL